jgi:ATP phosphoribosyltransferase
MREKDIPLLLEEKGVNNGICGQNTLESFNYYAMALKDVIPLIQKLPFGHCRLSIAGKTYLKRNDLQYIKVATSYQNILYNNINFPDYLLNVIDLTGSVEHAIELGIADAIFDIVETGETLRKSGLVEGETLMHSQAVLIGSNSDVIKDILFKIEATENAKNKKYVMLNCEKKSIELICHYLPSHTPTILPLVQDDMVAIHALCDEKELFKVLKTLSKIGAKDIIITSPEKVI